MNGALDVVINVITETMREEKEHAESEKHAAAALAELRAVRQGTEQAIIALCAALDVASEYEKFALPDDIEQRCKMARKQHESRKGVEMPEDSSVISVSPSDLERSLKEGWAPNMEKARGVAYRGYSHDR